MALRHNFQNVSWFYDLHRRSRVDLDPPYQRRSVWNRSFKEYFIDTILLGYPAPAIFLFEEIGANGITTYSVVDGKQRLTTIFEFLEDTYPVSEDSPLDECSGSYFSNLSDDRKKAFWAYEMLVEYVPSTDSGTIDNIFDRLNRNVAKLTRQELRHAKFDGEFSTAAENLAVWMEEILPTGFPRIAGSSRRQMKDVEFVAMILLLLEEGTRSTSQNDIDRAFAQRDEAWDRATEIQTRFRDALSFLKSITDLSADGRMVSSRFRNQADFYSLTGAIDELSQADTRPPTGDSRS